MDSHSDGVWEIPWATEEAAHQANLLRAEADENTHINDRHEHNDLLFL